MPFYGNRPLADEFHLREFGGNYAAEIFLAYPITLITGVLRKQELHEILRIVTELTPPPGTKDDFLGMARHYGGEDAKDGAYNKKSNRPIGGFQIGDEFHGRYC